MFMLTGEQSAQPRRLNMHQGGSEGVKIQEGRVAFCWGWAGSCLIMNSLPPPSLMILFQLICIWQWTHMDGTWLIINSPLPLSLFHHLPLATFLFWVPSSGGLSMWRLFQLIVVGSFSRGELRAAAFGSKSGDYGGVCEPLKSSNERIAFRC